MPHRRISTPCPINHIPPGTFHPPPTQATTIPYIENMKGAKMKERDEQLLLHRHDEEEKVA
ncbi:hypothetical protein LY78DRAFT_659046 [Colletotrichum sublineola]|nr:hypothetical protein LY78DRAFT_659046 [Colletotrichum sublineola]